MPDETPVATLDHPTTDAGLESAPRLEQSVHLSDVGPCRKHVRVIISRNDIDAKLKEKFKEMMPEVQVPGYRPGKAPRKLIEKKFFKEAADQLKGELLLQSLEQLAEDHQLNPISHPNIDPYKIELPENGPLTYEFEIEVAPEFDLPEYKGIQLKRPVKEISAAEVDEARRKFLSRFSGRIPKTTPAEIGDFLIGDLVITLGSKELSDFKELELRLDPQLAFKDGMVSDFGAKMAGVKVGETREFNIQLSAALVDESLRGQVARGRLTVQKIEQLEQIEPTTEFLASLGFEHVEELDARLREMLEGQFRYEQRQAIRGQILERIAAASTWELPNDLLHRQARRNLQRRILEMRNSGFSDEEIRARANILQQDILNSTAKGLKEHFVLQKIAEIEKIEVEDSDINDEIEAIAARSDESPRKVRARLQREDMMETLVAEILERKALELVMNHAVYTDVPYTGSALDTGGVEAAVSGEEEVEPEPLTTETESTKDAGN